MIHQMEALWELFEVRVGGRLWKGEVDERAKFLAAPLTSNEVSVIHYYNSTTFVFEYIYM